MKGSYLLLVKLEDDSDVSIGKLGKKQFYCGYYLYVGSALNGLERRIQRHLGEDKKMYWHIDYLMQHAKIKDIFYKESDVKEECAIAKTLDKELFSVPSFGCSDCGCKSHLFYGSLKDITNVIDKLEMVPYAKGDANA